jgi:hypothetical protein
VPGIRSYKHLNEVILEVLMEGEREMTAREIHYIILDRYSTDKVRINGVKIAKRLKGQKNVQVRYGTDGLCHYFYAE